MKTFYLFFGVLLLMSSKMTLYGQCTTPINLSLNKVSTQSTDYAGIPASRANDGDIYNFNHCAAEFQPWWQVDLGTTYNVTSIQITNRSGCTSCVNEARLKNFKVFLSNSPVTTYSDASQVYINTILIGDGGVVPIPLTNKQGRYVKVYADYPTLNYLHLAEVTVLGCVITGGNVSPTVSITSPTSGTSLPIGQTLTINATASDADGTISSVQFLDGTTVINSDATSPYSFNTNSLSVGIHSITAKATDNLNAVTTSLPINITINAATCSDGVQNGAETGVDCGGTCIACGGGTTGNAWSATTTSAATYRTGRVHIGQSNTNSGSETPAYNLYVTGGIKSDKLKIELPAVGGWADHVFNLDFHLSPIKEIKRYINANKHLPDFPSENSILNAGGYEVGDMIKRQQIAIESLYLYVIELEQKLYKVKVLEKTIEQLEKKVKGNKY